MSRGDEIPSVSELLWPTLAALRALGNRGTNREIEEQVVEMQAYTEAQLETLHNDGPRTELEYRLTWARSHLKGMGLIDNPARGQWATTAAGREVAEEDIATLRAEYHTRLRAERRARRASSQDDAAADETHDAAESWQEALLARLLDLSPEAFERLAQRLLRAAGFVNTSVTTRGADGGIDGVGVYQVSLVSFPIFFQCKRYRGTVGAEKVRDFRGAMAGRGEKGLLITTGTFTRDAEREATRDGAPPVDLIDGERLCDLLEQHQLGVSTTERTVRDVEIVDEFFEGLG